MTSLQKESEWEKVWKDNCFCIPAYKDRGMVDPGCSYCNTYDEVKEAITTAVSQRENEIAEEVEKMCRTGYQVASGRIEESDAHGYSFAIKDVLQILKH